MIQKPLNKKTIDIKDFADDAGPTGTPQRTTVNNEKV